MGTDERVFNGNRVCFYVIFSFAMAVVLLSLIRDFMILRQKKVKAEMLQRLNSTPKARSSGAVRITPFSLGKPPGEKEIEQEDEDEGTCIAPETDGYAPRAGGGVGAGGMLAAAAALGDVPSVARGAASRPPARKALGGSASLARLQSIGREVVEKEKFQKKFSSAMSSPSEATVDRWSNWLGVEQDLRTFETAALDAEEKRRRHHSPHHTRTQHNTDPNGNGGSDGGASCDHPELAASSSVVPGLGGGEASTKGGEDIEAGLFGRSGDVGNGLEAGAPAGLEGSAAAAAAAANASQREPAAGGNLDAANTANTAHTASADPERRRQRRRAPKGCVASFVVVPHAAAAAAAAVAAVAASSSFNTASSSSSSPGGSSGGGDGGP